MTQNYTVPLVDKDKNNIFPETLAKAIIDGKDNFVTLAGDQLSIPDKKKFTGQLLFNGKPVITALPDNLPVTVTDIFAINKSGDYFFTWDAKNKPSTATGSLADGYCKAIFKDADNGMVQFFGTGAFIEKYQGNWKSYVYPKN
ncbi:hypothetical protein N2E09_04565 [Leuconostoc citreum]